MAKPTPEELDRALAFAKHMRESGNDSEFLAKCLLSHNYRIGYLEEVRHAIERYLRSGMSEREHAILMRTLQKAREADDRSSGDEHTDIGLS